MASISFKGNPVTLAGGEVMAGQDAPDFRLQKIDMSDYTLATGAGKTRIIAAVPSLDTPVCDAETRRFNEEAVPVDVLAVSLFTRFRSRQESSFAEKTLSAMRQKFGGHIERPAGG